MADELTLTAETGRPKGSRAARRLRAEGKVPAVVYGLGKDTVEVTVDWRSLRQVLTTEAGLNALINLDVNGDTQLSIVKDLQRDPVRRAVVHVDFIRIDPKAEIEVEVPIVLEGEAEAVERESGTVAHVLFNLPIIAKPDAIPPQLTIDISHLEIGTAVRVGELELPEGVRTELDAEEMIAVGEMTRAEPEPEPEVEEGEEGEEGEGEEGAEGAEASADEDAEGEGGGDGGGGGDEG